MAASERVKHKTRYLVSAVTNATSRAAIKYIFTANSYIFIECYPACIVGK